MKSTQLCLTQIISSIAFLVGQLLDIQGLGGRDGGGGGLLEEKGSDPHLRDTRFQHIRAVEVAPDEIINIFASLVKLGGPDDIVEHNIGVVRHLEDNARDFKVQRNVSKVRMGNM